MIAVLASVPVVVRVDGGSPAVPAPAAPGNPLGSLPVTGLGLAIVLMAIVALVAGILLVRGAR